MDSKKISKLFFSICIFLFISTFDAAFAEQPDVKIIIDTIDKLYRSKTSRGQIDMTIITPDWERTFSIEAYTDGMDKTFIHIISPKKDQGIATLRVKDEMWNFFPKIGKVMKIPPSMMTGAWMGSDFTNDDLVKESTLLRDYNFRLMDKEGEAGLYYIELTPKKETPSVWNKIILKANRSDLLPVREEYYDEKGNMMRLLEFKDVKNFSGRMLPSVLEMTPLGKNKKGNKTIIKYNNLIFDAGLPKDTFTLRNLQKKR